MVKHIICIECPQGCNLTVDIEGSKVIEVRDNNCPKGKDYAVAEIENPRRILTTTVLGEGLSLKMVPVRTDKPIPKNRIIEAMNEIKKVKLMKPVSAGEVVIHNFLGIKDVSLIATRGTA